MRIDGGIPTDLTTAADAARRLEDAGYDGGFTAEVNHDPFLPLAVAAGATSRIELGTGIAVAFARNPMTLANIGWDLQHASKGRFVLGLGSQIQPHITKRFSMPWSHPAERMREFIGALHAIWDCWQTGAPLGFRGEYYRHTLMTPMFDPGPNPYGRPKVFLAAVGPAMTKVAAEVADGLCAHAFTTPSYFHDVTVPAVEAGLAASGRDRGDFEITMPVFVVTAADPAALADRVVATRRQIAFYASTPAYRPVLEHHGWGALGEELNHLSKQGEWMKMGDAVDDEVLHTFAVVGEPAALAPELHRRFGTALDRMQFYAADPADGATWGPVIDAIRSTP